MKYEKQGARIVWVISWVLDGGPIEIFRKIYWL